MGALRTKVAVAIVIMLGVTLGVALSDDSSASTDGLSMDGPAVIDLTVNGGTTDVVCGRIDGAGTTVAVSVADRGDLMSAGVECDSTTGDITLRANTSRAVDTTICILASSSGAQAMMYIRVVVHSSEPTDCISFTSIPDVNVQSGERREIPLQTDRGGCAFTVLDAPNWIHIEGSDLIVDRSGACSASAAVRVVATHDGYGSATMWLHVSEVHGGGFTGPSSILGTEGSGWHGEYRLSDSFASDDVTVRDHGMALSGGHSGTSLTIDGDGTPCTGYIDVNCSNGSSSYDVGRVWVDIAAIKVEIVSYPDLDAYADRSYEYQVLTSVPECTMMCSMTGVGGLSFDTSAGRLSGTPVSEGLINVTITAERSGFSSATQSFTIAVHGATRIIGPVELHAESGQTVTGRYTTSGYQVSGAGIYDTGGLNSGELSFNTDTNVMTVSCDRGVDTVVTLYADAVSGTAYLDVHVVVHGETPAGSIDITSTPPANPAAGDTYVYNVTTDVEGCTVGLINNPDWLSVRGSTVSGVAVAGTYTFMVTASKEGYYTDVQIITLDVDSPVRIVVSGPLTIEGNVSNLLERNYEISAPAGYDVDLYCLDEIHREFDRTTGVLEVYSSFAVDTTLVMVVSAGDMTSVVSIHVAITDPSLEPLDVDFDPPLKAVEGQYYSYTVHVNVDGCRMQVYGADWIGSDGLTICGTPKAGTYTVHVLIYDSGFAYEPFRGEYILVVLPAFVPGDPGHHGGGGVEVGPVPTKAVGNEGEVAVLSAAIAAVLLMIVAVHVTGRRR